jgi:hypothetical protein
LELLFIVLFVLWILPMFISMGCDNDHIGTLTGIIFSNSIGFGILWTVTLLPTKGMLFQAFGVIIFLLALLAYLGIWLLASDTFKVHFLATLRLGPMPKTKKRRNRRW